jgi:DSF synthase
MRVLASESQVEKDQLKSDDHAFLRRAHTATDALRQLTETAPLPLNLRFLSRPYSELEVSLDPNEKTLWSFWHPKGPPSFTLALLNDLNDMHRDIHKLFAMQGSAEDPPILFYVAGSNLGGIFNLGGDLGFFLDKIRDRDRSALLVYAYACVEAMYNNAYGFDVPVVSIGVVEGDALGGGLECALSFNVLIAERGVKMGFPEVLFNSFPGMGAFSFLSRKLDPVHAKKIIMSGRIYSSEEFYEMGLIDVLANKGEAREAARKFILENKRRHSLLYAMNKVQNKVNSLTKTELREVTEIWVDAALKIDPQDLRRMELLMSAQQRRLGNAGTAPLSARS